MAIGKLAHSNSQRLQPASQHVLPQVVREAFCFQRRHQAPGMEF